jgi:hypothetical protein
LAGSSGRTGQPLFTPEGILDVHVSLKAGEPAGRQIPVTGR